MNGCMYCFFCVSFFFFPAMLDHWMVCLYIYIYTCTYIHTYIHTYVPEYAYVSIYVRIFNTDINITHTIPDLSHLKGWKTNDAETCLIYRYIPM